MDAALLQTLLQAFVHREKVQTVDAALEQDIQLMLQIFGLSLFGVGGSVRW